MKITRERTATNPTVPPPRLKQVLSPVIRSASNLSPSHYRNQYFNNHNHNNHLHHNQSHTSTSHINPLDQNDSSLRLPKLCGDCDALNYCQLARNLGHNHSAHLTSHKVINGIIRIPGEGQSLPDQHILAEKLKLRYRTCPFHRELSLG